MSSRKHHSKKNLMNDSMRPKNCEVSPEKTNPTIPDEVELTKRTAEKKTPRKKKKSKSKTR